VEEENPMSQRDSQKPLSRFEKFISNKTAIFILILAIILLPILYLFFSQTALYVALEKEIGGLLEIIWTALAAAPNLIYSFIKNFRQKILFKNSRASVSTKKGPKVLLWILDGCSVQAFLDVAKKNEDLKALYEKGYFAQCVTIFPSITPAAHSTIMTGCYPAKTRIPAFDWVEVKTDYSGKETREYVRVMPDFKRFQTQASSGKYRKEFFKGLGDALNLNQRFLSPIVYTIFETLGEDCYTESIKEWIHRGADNFIGVSINDVLDDLVSKKIIEQRSMTELLTASFKEVSYEFGDLIWGAGNSRQLADLMVYWKSGTDTVSHEYGPHAIQVREQIDEAIDKLAETLRFYKMYTNQPIYVVITSDHSQSEVTAFSNLIEDFKVSLGGKYKIASRNDMTNTDLINTAKIIVANNDRAAFFYAFGEPQTKEQLRNETIDYLKVRKDVDLILYEDGEKTKVIQVSNDGPSAGSNDINDFFKDKEDTYPNAVERVEGLMKGKNWGDIVISMKEGYSLNPDFKPEKEGERILHGDHGGLNSSDSIGPLLVWGPTIKENAKDENWERFRTVDIASTIAAIFNKEQRIADGRTLKEMFQSK